MRVLQGRLALATCSSVATSRFMSPQPEAPHVDGVAACKRIRPRVGRRTGADVPTRGRTHRSRRRPVHPLAIGTHASGEVSDIARPTSPLRTTEGRVGVALPRSSAVRGVAFLVIGSVASSCEHHGPNRREASCRRSHTDHRRGGADPELFAPARRRSVRRRSARLQHGRHAPKGQPSRRRGIAHTHRSVAPRRATAPVACPRRPPGRSS